MMISAPQWGCAKTAADARKPRRAQEGLEPKCSRTHVDKSPDLRSTIAKPPLVSPTTTSKGA
eukprot:5120646-Amphidinium_carterae.1